ncbi:MAG: class I SAM-dependent methyltransferase [Candidatus Thiosymbion ectosymbiont of Robbea hypermnestra]|nr:class I SAM-dependent methyltransferase [Candidatus Thiosymbion ectosymbiont of Robbea hypermnestra]
MKYRKLYIGKKRPEYYDGLLMRADTGLHEQIAQSIESKIRKGGSIIDMGAGQGALSARLHDMGYKVTAVDTNDHDYVLAGRDITYIHVNFDEEKELEGFIADNEATFDMVCGVEVIEHVENPWAYVRGLIRLAKKGGFVLITTPNTNSWLSRLHFLMTGKFLCFEEQNLAYGHINPLANFELHLIMTGSGLENVELYPAGTLPPLYLSSPRMVIRSFVCLLLRPFQKGMLDGWCVIAVGKKTGNPLMKPRLE